MDPKSKIETVNISFFNNKEAKRENFQKSLFQRIKYYIKYFGQYTISGRQLIFTVLLIWKYQQANWLLYWWLWLRSRLASASVIVFWSLHRHVALNDLIDTLLTLVLSCSLVWYITCQVLFLVSSWDQYEVIEDGDTIEAKKPNTLYFWRNYSYWYYYCWFFALLFDISHVKSIFFS